MQLARHCCANVWVGSQGKGSNSDERCLRPRPASFAGLCACAGDKPEQLYPEARQELRALGYESTLEYAANAAGTVMRETGLLPHINAGTMGLAEVPPALPALPAMHLSIPCHAPSSQISHSTQLITPPAKGPIFADAPCEVLLGQKHCLRAGMKTLLDQVLSGMKEYELAVMVLWLN